MKITPTQIADVLLLEPRVLEDSRGYFMETFRLDALHAALGFQVGFVQDNESCSRCGVLRGLHYQLPPFAQSKLVRVVAGCVLDVAVDIRRESPTFGACVSTELSAENKRQIFIPRGFAHGFVVLSEVAVVQYKVDNYYSSKSDRGIVYNDPHLGIDWRLPADQLLLSDKDSHQPSLKEAELFPAENLYE
ncbi:dTDP-4-dehydrorhamnose 3,5-epimerase [Desulfurispirillum indicum S5]|uniref:dTDP-4-dehydrorhamnose 3,5-epimerase n=1 Tax=Desulfurispirillum indicum (strain ATCC BAA-1389 / DSM 22839 / S5) TaxID=653733 RepID=E6W5A1_DESIS|nr:dTDP-4-dehydrorhamnose 3,5-epimerase [Desulfurispirillum indicum]ADU67180.1 dTDP-4-dehydrorhamnose 3,5-epimerase [Desulfurispirillum indicum S5]